MFTLYLVVMVLGLVALTLVALRHV